MACLVFLVLRSKYEDAAGLVRHFAGGFIDPALGEPLAPRVPSDTLATPVTISISYRSPISAFLYLSFML